MKEMHKNAVFGLVQTVQHIHTLLCYHQYQTIRMGSAVMLHASKTIPHQNKIEVEQTEQMAQLH